MRENLGAIGWNLTPTQAAKLDSVSARLPPYPYWHQSEFAERNPSPVAPTLLIDEVNKGDEGRGGPGRLVEKGSFSKNASDSITDGSAVILHRDRQSSQSARLGLQKPKDATNAGGQAWLHVTFTNFSLQ